MNVLIQIFLAHILGDFFFQSNHWVKDKELRKWRSPYLYLHAAVHFALLILVTGLMTRFETSKPGFFYYLWPAALIALSHLVIDGLKLSMQTPQTKRAWFFADQALHLLVLLSATITTGHLSFNKNTIDPYQLLAILVAVLLLTRPASLLIRTVISRWPPDMSDTSKTPVIPEIKNIEQRSLENAGELIGILERLIVLMFILLNKWEGVGFLLAAKSVFRFGDLKDAKDMKLTEYVLIGTLLSFGIAILTGLLITAL